MSRRIFVATGALAGFAIAAALVMAQTGGGMEQGHDTRMVAATPDSLKWADGPAIRR